MGSLSDILPGDLVEKILLSYPLKRLLRLKSVSKSWDQLLTSPDFMKLRSLSFLPDSQPRVLYLDYWKNKVMFLYGVKDWLFHGISKLRAPRSLHFGDSTRWGLMVASHGILCCLSRLIIDKRRWDYFYVVNPTTGRQNSITDFPGAFAHHFGFYFDPILHNFKILAQVEVMHQSTEVNDIMYVMFDSSTGQWRRPQNSIPDRSCTSAPMVSIENTCYYMYKDNQNLVAFNMDREEGEIIFVQELLRGSDFRILEWDGRLALLQSTNVLDVKVWVLIDKKFSQVIHVDMHKLCSYVLRNIQHCCLFGKTLIIYGDGRFEGYNIMSGQLISSSVDIQVGNCGYFIAYNPTLYSWNYS
ncbi:hypothetical protein AMTRI_Chr03g139110 [Amborella trichopoda]|nr:F-box protein At3g57590 [Amborella trichopoda]|eukprot:XP_006850096.2 F-box protein At3g57590 [Amborella trichopoda]